MRRGVWMALIMLGGCVSSGQHQAIVEERDALSAQVSTLKSKVSDLENANARLEVKVKDGQRRLEELDAGAKKARLEQARAAIGLAPGQKMNATLATDLGDIHCELWPDVAPITVQNFVQLSAGGREWTDPNTGKKRTDALYPGTIFHRVIPGFMVQGGDPLGNGMGGPGYEFEDEFSPDVRFDQPGLLAMANAGPRTNGSQFFITDSTPKHLNDKHTIFGKCDLETVRKILGVKLVGPDGSTPEKPIKLQKVQIQRG